MPDKIDINNLKSDTPLDIEKLTYDVTPSSSVFLIKRIQAQKKISLIISVYNPIDIQKILIDNNNHKIDVQYFSHTSNSLITSILKMLAFLFIFTVISYIIEFFKYKQYIKIENENSKNRQEKLEYAEKTINRLETELNAVRSEIDNNKESFKDEINNLKIYSSKRNLILLSRIRDYKNELNFWKDTIRKILYNQKFDNKEVTNLFNFITNNLKTYGTLEEKDVTFDDVKILANILKDYDSTH